MTAVEKRVTRIETDRPFRRLNLSDNMVDVLIRNEMQYAFNTGKVSGDDVMELIGYMKVIAFRFNNFTAAYAPFKPDDNDLLFDHDFYAITVNEFCEAIAETEFEIHGKNSVAWQLYETLYGEEPYDDACPIIVEMNRDVPYMAYELKCKSNKPVKIKKNNIDNGPYIHSSCIFELNYDQFENAFNLYDGEFIAGYVNYDRYYIPIAVVESEAYNISVSYFSEVSCGAIFIDKKVWKIMDIRDIINLLYTKIPLIIMGDYFYNNADVLSFAVQHIGYDALYSTFERMNRNADILDCYYDINSIPVNIKKHIKSKIHLFLTDSGKASREF